MAVFESADKRKDGTYLHVEVSARLVDYNGRQIIQSIVRDINDRKTAEELISSTLKEKEIKSPIAGVISSIYVKKDDPIRTGQKVATLIAMKMENEIVAETAGVVKEVKAKENQTVKTGDTLIILK